MKEIMIRETFIINNKEYAASKIAAFAANGIILKLQKLILPVLAESAGNKDVMDMDISAMARLVSERLDESVVNDIILPMYFRQFPCRISYLALFLPMLLTRSTMSDQTSQIRQWALEDRYRQFEQS